MTIAFPRAGLRHDGLVLRLPTDGDLPVALRAFGDDDLAERANLPPLDEATLRSFIAHLDRSTATGEMIPVLIEDEGSGEILGGASIQNIDLQQSVADIGYWLFPEARGHGVATRAARAMAAYGFALGVSRIQAYVHVGNDESERVLERAGFTREGVLRSLPRNRGGRGDSTLFSLLAGE